MKKTAVSKKSALMTARARWQLGIWDELGAIEPGAPAPDKRDRDRIELLQYLVQGALQTGQTAAARDALAAMREAGAGRDALLRALLSSAFNSLGRAWLVAGKAEKAERCLRRAVGFYPELGEEDLVAGMRFDRQFRDLLDAGAPVGHLARGGRERCLFIDCGGYDGCSAMMFLLTHPHYDCVSFEPNPELWHYYDDIPTQLVPKAAYTYDGEISFTIDPVDFDGSTVMEGKRVDVDGNVPDAECPVMTVPCVDLSAFVREASGRYDRIVLKLDVEGAEYDILEKMLADGTIEHIEKLYCEFHDQKMPMEPGRHERVVSQVREHVPVEEWDALPFSFSRRETSSGRRQRRAHLIRAIRQNRQNTIPVSFEG